MLGLAWPRRADTDVTGRYEQALNLYTGDLLPEDRYDDWASQRREELRALHLTLLGELAELHEQQRDLSAAVDTFLRNIAADPAHEEAHADLMRLYAQTGQRHRALRQFRQLR